MNFEEALVTELASIPSIANKAFPLFAIEGTKPPFIVYSSSEGEQTQVLTGFTNLKEVLCELNVITESYAEMKEITKLAIEKVTSFFGRSIGTNGPFIKSISYERPSEFHEQEYGYYRSSFDLTIWIETEEDIAEVIELIGRFNSSSEMKEIIKEQQNLSVFVVSNGAIKGEATTLSKYLDLSAYIVSHGTIKGEATTLSGIFFEFKVKSDSFVSSTISSIKNNVGIPIEALTETKATTNRTRSLSPDGKVASLSSISGDMSMTDSIFLDATIQSNSLTNADMSITHVYRNANLISNGMDTFDTLTNTDIGSNSTNMLVTNDAIAGNAFYHTHETGTWVTFTFPTTLYFPVTPNEPHIFSAYVKDTGTINSLQEFNLVMLQDDFVQHVNTFQIELTPSEYKRFYFTFTPTTSQCRLRLNWSKEYPNMFFDNLMLEKALEGQTVPSEWVPYQ